MRAAKLGVVVLGVLLCGCLGALNERLDRIEKRQDAGEEQTTFLANRITELQNQHDIDEHRMETLLRGIYGKLYCDNEKVRAFIRECEIGSPVCSDQGWEAAREYMNTQAYVFMYLKPEGIKSLYSVRRGMLMNLIDPRNLHISTRFVVLVQPRSDSVEHHKEAERVGTEVLRFLKFELGLPRSYTTLGAHILPCRIKQKKHEEEWHKQYKRLKGEPLESEPSIRVWVYRSDC